MSLVVQKFGGTSVADSGKILSAARRAINTARQGHRVLMVVSARGHTTDELIKAALEINERPPAREMDMLLSTGEQVSVALMAMAIEALGERAISFTGGQIGLVTDSFHTKARIKNIDPQRILAALEDGFIVIVAGFQGVDEHYNITTLGRGGSDTTAVALAAALKADVCEIYTDVDGVFTTDPRIVAEARRIDKISFDEMLELASLGAGVMHSRSIEFAKKYGVRIHVRNSMSDAPGTWIVGDNEARRLGVCVTGAALARDEARVTVLGVPDQPGAVHTLFREIADRRIMVDMIVQNVATDGLAEVSFTVAASDLADTLLAAEAAARAVGARRVVHDPNVSKVSVVGTGMRYHHGVAATMFEALASVGINIQMITTSEIKISALVARDQAAAALRAVHAAFKLECPPQDDPPGYVPQPPIPSVDRTTDDLVVELDDPESHRRFLARPDSGMEGLVITAVDLDDTQARLTLESIPDRPGYAASIFRAVADAGIMVDMIVQNAGVAGSASLSFTVPRQDGPRTLEVIRTHPEVQTVILDENLAKLAVAGIGMRSHVGVAVRMFGALAARDINIALINTSEVRINVAVDRSRAAEALQALRDVFGIKHPSMSNP
ncbi:aspartate kinase [Isosphaera pallida ATCC 43644]|uniref:aspartate kinase n=1 Tax=Isosphaera pallida (strain ATCC 43644 / DSM 9630 / IS1B) TaxID=575540 RepID=E8R059_ISOPI|nr:aspartate kinase [Isosphaera pallida]ADV61177.1 aspartate kinase [Isosphaera pallida ATCC 43644]